MPHPLAIAHRGASSEAPENTMAAFRRAIELGVDMIELDVRRTADGALVVFHDDTLTRITGTEGRVEDKSAEELARLDAGAWFGPAFVGEHIPTLAEVLDLVRGRATLDVEVKVPPDKRHLRELIEAVATALKASGGHVAQVVSSFDADLVSTARPLLAPVPVCRILAPPDSVGDDYGPHQPYAILHGRLVTPDVVRRVHAAGAQVLVWTLDDEAHIEEAWRAGVDGICSNHPARLLALRARWSAA